MIQKINFIIMYAISIFNQLCYLILKKKEDFDNQDFLELN